MSRNAAIKRLQSQVQSGHPAIKLYGSRNSGTGCRNLTTSRLGPFNQSNVKCKELIIPLLRWETVRLYEPTLRCRASCAKLMHFHPLPLQCVPLFFFCVCVGSPQGLGYLREPDLFSINGKIPEKNMAAKKNQGKLRKARKKTEYFVFFVFFPTDLFPEEILHAVPVHKLRRPKSPRSPGRFSRTEAGGWGEREEVPRAQPREGHSSPRGPHQRWQCARGGGRGDSLREHGRLRRIARQTSG